MSTKLKTVDCPKIWDTLHNQWVDLAGDVRVNIATLISKTANLPIYKLPLYYMTLPTEWLEDCSMREIVGHIKMIQDADLTKPIILSPDGYILDGKHRLAKALLNNHTTILAVRLEEGPTQLIN